LAATTLAAQSLKFDFTSGKLAPGFTPVPPTTKYSEELGYGF
jgi:hypothetical protein